MAADGAAARAGRALEGFTPSVGCRGALHPETPPCTQSAGGSCCPQSKRTLLALTTHISICLPRAAQLLLVPLLLCRPTAAPSQSFSHVDAPHPARTGCVRCSPPGLGTASCPLASLPAPRIPGMPSLLLPPGWEGNFMLRQCCFLSYACVHAAGSQAITTRCPGQQKLRARTPASSRQQTVPTSVCCAQLLAPAWPLAPASADTVLCCCKVLLPAARGREDFNTSQS